jgi:hypothetical protein
LQLLDSLNLLGTNSSPQSLPPARYLYLDKGNIATGVIASPATTITSHMQDNMVRAGLNYRFAVGW